MLIRLRYAVAGAVIAAVGAGVPAAIVTGAVKMGYVQVSRSGATTAPSAGGGTNGVEASPFGNSVMAPPRRLIVPDLVAVRAAGLSAAQVSAIGGLAGVRAVLAVDGGRVTIGGQPASVLGVPPQAFRSWTPPATAADAGIWAGLAAGQIVADQAAAGRLGLTAGRGPGRADAAGPRHPRPRRHGTQPGPGGDRDRAPGRRQCAGWPPVQLARPVPGVGGGVLPGPVLDGAGRHRPDRERRRRQPGAVQRRGAGADAVHAVDLAELGHRRVRRYRAAGHHGPVRRRAVGRRMLCAAGAASGGAALASAIFGYNHADWYVSEVLALAAEYAQEYS